MTRLQLLTIKASAIAISSTLLPSEKEVRIHGNLIWRSGAWIRLWYFLRGLDSKGRGRVDVPVCLIESFLQTHSSTIYEWLRDGRKLGGFQRYIIRKGMLRVYLTGLCNLCWSLDIEDIGAVSVVKLEDICTLRQIKREAVKASADRGQYASIHQQRLQLSEAERKYYKPVFPEQIFQEIDRGSSAKPDRGTIACLLWKGPKKLFVSAGFLPFGKSQDSLAWDLGVSVDTVQRHLRGTESRQVVQTKSAYRTVGELFEHCQADVPRREIRPRTFFQINSEGLGFLEEPSGQSSVGTSTVVRRERVFKYGGRYWMCRCNIYRPTSKFTSMARRRDNLQWRFKLWKEARNRLAKLIDKFFRAGILVKEFSIRFCYPELIKLWVLLRDLKKLLLKWL